MKTHAMPDAIWIRDCFVMVAMKRILHLKPRCWVFRSIVTSDSGLS
jgi:hypothetical protein